MEQSQITRAIHTIQCNGQPSTDRLQWQKEAYQFGVLKYGGASSQVTEQREWLRALHKISRQSLVDGGAEAPLQFWHVLQARAELLEAKTPGPDALPTEALKNIPYTLLMQVWQLFTRRLLGFDGSGPREWKMVQLIGIPKEKRLRS